MARVLVTGAGGQVGRALLRATWPAGVDVVPAPRAHLDVCDGPAVRRVVDDARPAAIINAAAYTAVDRAEAEPRQAFAVNAEALTHLARAADRHRALLIHLSTDYVFDGTGSGWYDEDDPPNPLSVYGATKLAGEERALTARRSVVVRTSWVFGAHGHNFVRAVRDRARRDGTVAVVADQRACPTAADDLADGLVRMVAAGGHDLGVFHVAAPDDASRFELATAALAHALPAVSAAVVATTSDQRPTLARRPANSCLDSRRATRAYGIVLRSWRTALAAVSEELNELES